MSHLLACLGFVPYEMKANAIERDLITDLWAMLKADKTGGVPFETLRCCLLAIVGVNQKEKIKEGESPEKDPNEEGDEEQK